jgi:heat shock protein HtpX
MPQLYLMEESQPNAFATGRDPKHGVVVVTRGLVEKLEKTELEGVLAHELSHIGNRDALLMAVVVILAGIVTNLADFFLRSNIGFQSRDDDSRANALLTIITVVLALLAPLAALLVQLAISRKREFLADASAVLLTRYPEGLALALEKISRDHSPLAAASSATSHLYIANPFKGRQAGNWLVKLFSTHPPIEERIKALREMNV